ncbi:ADP-ribosylglycohydrolase family protein [Spongiibacter marinus]|uniref:ADP-ribosylglycohydrolase family protein n=1 Tax=Spongiibacter marinus TaxID=354246 RepID=UPI0035BE27D6
MAEQSEHWAANSADYQRACLLGGAVGDALGAPVQFFSLDDIMQQYGERGVLDYMPAYGRKGAVTDDTQRLMFTAEGILRYRVASARGEQPDLRSFIHRADLRWLSTQTTTTTGQQRSFLLAERGLYSQRAARDSFLAVLSKSQQGGVTADNQYQFGVGLSRIAPLAVHFVSDTRKFWGEALRAEMFSLSADISALSDGHVNGRLTGGALGILLLGLLYGHPPEACLARIDEQLRPNKDSQALRRAIDHAVELANAQPNSASAAESLCGDSMALDVFSVALYSLLCAEDFASGLVLSVNHSGLSDSCGALAGQLLGAWRGLDDIPQHWLQDLEHKALLDCLAADFLKSPEDPLMKQRYGG